MSKNHFSTRFVLIATTLIVCLITSNFFVPRLWQVAGLPLQLSGAVLLFPVTYILNDCVTEVYGYRKARFVIWLAFVLSAFVALMAQLVCWLPAPLKEESVPVAEAFNSLFGLVKGFGWRAIISSVAGEAADSLIFFPAVFWGVMPLAAVLQLAISQVIAKLLYEVVALPLTSWFVNSVKRAEGIDTYDRKVSYNPFRIKDF